MGAVTVAVRLQWWKRSGLLPLAFGTVIPGVKLIPHREAAGMGSIRGVLSSTYWKWPLDGPQLRHSGEAKEQERRGKEHASYFPIKPESRTLSLWERERKILQSDEFSLKTTLVLHHFYCRKLS